MRKISAVGLFCCDKFEKTPKQKVIDLSKFKIFYFSICSLGYSLFFLNSHAQNWITLFKKYLHMMLKTERIFFVCYKLTKLEQITFQYTEMAGKLSNLNLVSFKNYFY